MQTARLLSTTRNCLAIWKRNSVLRRCLTTTNVTYINKINSNLNKFVFFCRIVTLKKTVFMSRSSSSSSSSLIHGQFLSINRSGWTTMSVRYASSDNLPTHKRITLPALSPTMETGTLRSWAKQEGDPVAEGKCCQ